MTPTLTLPSNCYVEWQWSCIIYVYIYIYCDILSPIYIWAHLHLSSWPISPRRGKMHHHFLKDRSIDCGTLLECYWLCTREHSGTGSLMLQVSAQKMVGLHPSLVLTHLPLLPHIESVNWVSIRSGNDLPPVRRQAITWTNAGLLSCEQISVIHKFDHFHSRNCI